MPTAEDFDEFYVQSRRRLLLQAFALTGDLHAARAGVRDAYVQARHHWAKVGRLAEPEDWVRPRAWAISQRRHSARPWHREKGLADEQTTVLEALQKLPDAERKTLLLTHLAALPMSGIGREIGVTRERAEQYLQSATAAMALALDIDSSSIRPALESLEPALGSVRLPRAPIIRRSGLRRRRLHAVIGSLVLVATTLGAGAFVVQDQEPDGRAGARAAEEPAELVPASMLLKTGGAKAAAPGQRWQLVRTHDNTGGDGINSLCQQARFADVEGLGTWVRQFRSTGEPERRLTETVEISGSPGAAGTAYDTTLGWFAGCDAARLQLLNAYKVDGVGNEARLLLLRIPAPQQRSYFVGVARTGSLTVSNLVETRAGKPPRPRRVMQTLAASVRNLCESPAADACVAKPKLHPMRPPPSGEGAGMLAVADLPALRGIRPPWVGTDPAPARRASAATTCDQTDFKKAGAVRTRARTFVIPKSKLPKRFGISQTVVKMPSAGKAKEVLAKMQQQMATCEDRQLSSDVVTAVVVPEAYQGSQFALWRLESEINQEEKKVAFWMGAARVGKYVTQLSFAPVERADVDEQTFRALVQRARDRLYELRAPGVQVGGASPSPSPSASPSPASDGSGSDTDSDSGGGS